MRKSVLFAVIILNLLLLILLGCAKKLYEHINPFDPLAPKINSSTNSNTPPTPPSYSTGSISFNKSLYYTLKSNALITLSDADLTLGTQDINVKSTSDPSGITLTLNKSGSVYTGLLGFTNNTSAPGRKIRVANGDTITATYNDANPTGDRLAYATWITNTSSTQYFWIYSDVHASDFLYDQSNPPVDFGGKLGTWPTVGGPTLSDDTVEVPSGGGSKSLKIVYGAAGGCYWLFCDNSYVVTDENFSAFVNGHLNFWVKSTVNCEIKLEDNDGVGASAVSQYLNNVTTLDGTWRYVSIPLSYYYNGGTWLNFSRLKVVIGVHYTTGATVWIDEIHFTSN